MTNNVIVITNYDNYVRIEEQLLGLKYYCSIKNIKFNLFIENNVKKIKNILINIKNTLIIFVRINKKFISNNINNNIYCFLCTEQMTLKPVQDSVYNNIYKSNFNFLLDYNFVNMKIFNDIKKPKIPHLYLPFYFYNINMLDKKLETKQEYDVLFLGKTKLRLNIIQKCIDMKLNVLVENQNCFSKDKWDLLLKTKCIIDCQHNLEFTAPNPHRCIPAIQHGCFVFSTLQIDKNNEEINPYYKFVNMETPESIVQSVKNTCDNYDKLINKYINNIKGEINIINCFCEKNLIKLLC